MNLGWRRYCEKKDKISNHKGEGWYIEIIKNFINESVSYYKAIKEIIQKLEENICVAYSR